MSNKMLWKRLLATGMSMAMAATLFATNSITTFAEGETSILVPPSDNEPALVIPGGGEENQEPPVEPTDGLPAPEV